MGRKSGKKNQKKPAATAQSSTVATDSVEALVYSAHSSWLGNEEGSPFIVDMCDIQNCPCEGYGVLVRCAKCCDCDSGLRHSLMPLREQDGKPIMPVTGNDIDGYRFPCINISVHDRKNDLVILERLWAGEDLLGLTSGVYVDF